MERNENIFNSYWRMKIHNKVLCYRLHTHTSLSSCHFVLPHSNNTKHVKNMNVPLLDILQTSKFYLVSHENCMHCHLYPIRCDGRHVCTMKASNSRFHDNCPGTHKYLEVNYYCEPGIVPIKHGGLYLMHFLFYKFPGFYLTYSCSITYFIDDAT